MDLHRIGTENAIELYLQHPTLERGTEILHSLRSWPFDEAGRHAGMFLACYDAMRAKHGATGWRAKLAAWLIRRWVAPWLPTWNDYWLLYWELTRDRPELARPALTELHHRAWHLLKARPGEARSAEWGMLMETARGAVVSEAKRNPEFRTAILTEIADSPCRLHRELLNDPPMFGGFLGTRSK